MSSKRGRKRNDNLPPNRARDVQRAFRARRAAHLQALEQRVSELEEENSCLRQALNLPPANRTPLGKGPTGKDKPRQMESVATSQPIGIHSSRDSSNGDSPASRTSSLSPCTFTVSMPTRSMQVIDSGAWDDPLLVNEPQSDVSGHSGSSYGLTPMSAPSPMKPLQFASYSTTSLPSSSRSSVSSMYMAPTTHYAQSSDRIAGTSFNGHAYSVRSDMRDEPPRQYSSFPHAAFQATDGDIHVHSPPPSIPPSHAHHRESPLPYPHRRCLTEPQGYTFSQGYSHLSHPTQIHARGPEYPRLPDGDTQCHPNPNPHPHPHSHPPTTSRSVFTSDGRINSIN
ncbi:hypothetical protein AMATHDRAFT_138495 [Amanita thiersii Skay4041]|uniref:BZIP domain-containing protein n=1 Tax=Amanita thiersii Skay4041 TaxID=703135 RepID=A0A2A9NUQ7_9AGAR|nr:hypothetical protein AMATHDRAFT_138495 [Amanita thiersii Skay4041]